MKTYTREEMIQLVNDYECSRTMGEISTPSFEDWLDNRETYKDTIQTILRNVGL